MISEFAKAPNFILIGAQKSGSTALYQALSQHPKIFMSKCKEPEFFLSPDDFSQKSQHSHVSRLSDWDSYLELFSSAQTKSAIGEASVMYLSSYYPELTAARIKRRLPDVKLIAVLRHPADRAYSAYTFFTARGIETKPTFKEALAIEPDRIIQGARPDLYYLSNGLYFANLGKFYQHFPREQIKVFLYEDWDQKPQRVLSEIFKFLAVEEFTSIYPQRRAVTKYVRSTRFRNAITKCSAYRPLSTFHWCQRMRGMLLRMNLVSPPPLEPVIRSELTDFFRKDILQLQQLIGRDLSHWLK